MITQPMQVTDRQIAKYGDLIYKKTGIRISPQKKSLLSNRLRRRLRDTGIESFEAYFKHLQQLRSQDAEWDAFLQEITTHETYLFRDEGQWDWFRKIYLPEVSGAARQGKRRKSLKIWSAACSTGDEPITLACCALDALVNASSWEIEIVATDIGVATLETARKATFGPRAMKLVSESYRRRFFQRIGAEELWEAKPAVRNLIRFKQHNLIEPMSDGGFDLVVLKNVLIYFDKESKPTVLKHVRKSMAPGALLMAGGSEGITDHVRDFAKLQPWLFRLSPPGASR